MTDEDKQQRHQPPKQLIEPYHYINSVPGKDVRGKLIDCFNLWLGVPTQSTNEIKSIIADLHNASLLIDDIEDNSKLRRGIPVAHSIFGVAPVINTANYVYFLALERCHALKNDEAMNVFVKEMLDLHRGQGYDIHWRDTVSCPTEEEYFNMILDKTGGLFRLAVGLLQSFATTNKHVDYVPLVNNLGLYFQIRDDLINLADDEYMKSKSFCEDLTEGKFSYPIIHCIRSGGESSSAAVQLLSVLKQRTEDIDVKRYAQRLMLEAGSLRYTREKCSQLKDEIVKQIEELGGNQPLLKVIQMLDVQVAKIGEKDTEPNNSAEDVKIPSSLKQVDADAKNLDYT